MKFKYCLALSLGFISQLALSEDEMFEDDIALSFEDQYVSIATGYEEVLSRAPAVASVISQQQIEAMGAKSLDDILVSIPGLHVGISGFRFSPIYTIRGIHTTTNAQVLVLINNVPITQLFRGDRGWFTSFPASSIKQIEVIRGPGSAVYGADAFAGVINVITKTANEIEGLHVKGGVGSFDSQEASVLFGSSHNAVDYIFSLDYFTTDGDQDRTVITDTQTLFDNNPGLNNTNVSFASGPEGPGVLQTQREHFDIRAEVASDKWHLRAWNSIRRNMGTGPGDSQTIDTMGSFDTNNYLLDLSYKAPLINEKTRFQSTLSYMKVDYNSYLRLFPPGTVLPIDDEGNINGETPVGTVEFTNGFIGAPNYKEEHTRLDMQLFFTDIGDHRIRLGAGALQAKLTPTERKNFGPGVLDADTLDGDPLPGQQSNNLTSIQGENLYISTNERKLFYFSAQDQWYISPNWDLSAGVRYDKYSDFGSTTNPRAALIWHPSFDLTTKLLYGKAFRAPGYAELYLQNNPSATSDPDLEPEEIEMLELAIDYQINFDLNTRLSLFQYEIDNLIQYINKPGVNGVVASNVGEREAPGFEWEISWKATEDLELLGNYSFHDARDTQNGGPVADTPRQKLFLLTKWDVNNYWNINAIVNWIADRQRMKDDPRDDIDDYITTDLVVTHKHAGQSWKIELLIKNLFDVNAKEPSAYDPNTPNGASMVDDYPLESRSLFISFWHHFQ